MEHALGICVLPFCLESGVLITEEAGGCVGSTSGFFYSVVLGCFVHSGAAALRVA